jgi:hypothetical protein
LTVKWTRDSVEPLVSFFTIRMLVNPMFVPVPEKWAGGEPAAVAAAEMLHKKCLPVFFFWFAR